MSTVRVKRCGYCKHLWRFHSQERKDGPRSCSKCIMREDKGVGFLKKGQPLNSNYFHDLRARMPNCSCFKVHAKGVCPAVVFHGPGHQSHTHCCIRGRHEIHQTEYGQGRARWRKAKVFSGYFDEPPQLPEDR